MSKNVQLIFAPHTVKKVSDFPVPSRDVTYGDGKIANLFYSTVCFLQGCESTDKSANRDRGTRTRIGSGASFFWVSLSNLVIDDNFRISNNLGLGLAANISAALPIQPVRDREIEIIL